jgi:secreted Zn-dependent insulinase-like peptidase
MDSITELLYEARLGGLNFNIEVTSKGLQLIFSGFSQKMPAFAEQLLELLKAYKPDPATYARFRDVKQREIESWRTQQPYYHSSYHHSQATETMQYPIQDLKRALERSTIKDLLPEGGYIAHAVSTPGSYGT